MLIHSKTLIAAAATLCLTGSAFAGASLDTLLNGGSLFSNNGELLFSEFVFTPILNAPSAADIDVVALDSGLRFRTSGLANDDLSSTNFQFTYSVAGQGVQITGVQQQGGSSAGGGANVVKIVSDQRAELGILFTSSLRLEDGLSIDGPQERLFISDDVFAATGQSDADLIAFEQTFETTGTTPTAVPTPTAALAGAALLSVFGLRRRRGA